MTKKLIIGAAIVLYGLSPVHADVLRPPRLYALELAIRNYPVEHGYALDSDGNLLHLFMGNDEMVFVPARDEGVIKDHTFLHNHPYPYPPYYSLSDVYFMWRTNPQTFVTVGWLWSSKAGRFVAYDCIADRGLLPSWEAHYPDDVWQGKFSVPYLYGQPELMDKFLQSNADGSAWKAFFDALHIKYSCQAL